MHRSMRWSLVDKASAELLILDPGDYNRLKEGFCASLTTEDKLHFRKSLRKTGSIPIFAGNGGGGLISAKIDESDAIVPLEKEITIAPPLAAKIVMPLIKRKYLEYLIQKCGEIGISEIEFIRSRYGVYKHDKKMRLDKIARSACNQSKNPYLPRIVFSELSLEAYLEHSVGGQNAAHCLHFWGDFGSDLTLPMAVSRQNFEVRSLCFFNGPEGGWAPEEVGLLKNRFPGVLLSHHVLRSDTAAVCAATAMRTLLDNP